MRLIDADKLKQHYAWWNDENKELFDAIVDIQPTVEPQEAKRGKMNVYKPRRMNRNATYKCSVCGKLCSSYYNDVGEWKYCPHCGAKLEKEKTENE